MLKFSPSKFVYLIGCSTLVYLLYKIFATSPRLGLYSRTCDHSLEYLISLHNLVANTHSILEKLGLTHILCYGSLAGQIRIGRSLPWEDGAEMCVFNEDIVKYDEVYIGNVFRQDGLRILYDSAEGRYLVSRENPPLGEEAQVVKLVVFADDKELQEVNEPTYHRIGWKRRLLPPNCEYSSSLDCFPKRLVTKPLPTREFGSSGPMPVPREQFELLKYHFPDSWWKEEKPLNC